MRDIAAGKTSLINSLLKYRDSIVSSILNRLSDKPPAEKTPTIVMNRYEKAMSGLDGKVEYSVFDYSGEKNINRY